MRILNHFDLLMWLVVKDESDACFPALFESHIVQAFLASAVVPVRGNNSSQYTKRPDLRRLFRLSFFYQWVMSELQSVSGGGGRTWIPLTHLRHLNLSKSDQFIEQWILLIKGECNTYYVYMNIFIFAYLSWVSEGVLSSSLNKFLRSATEKCFSTSSSLSTTQEASA